LRAVGRALLVAILAAGCAAWGFFTHRNHIFPYGLLRRAREGLQPQQRARRFNPMRPGERGSPETIQEIASLPYLRGYRPASGRTGIRVYERGLAQDGLNLLTSGHAPVVSLMDMNGMIVKTWKADAFAAFPGLPLSRTDIERAQYLTSACLTGDGGIVAMFDHIGLVRLDTASRPVWTYRENVHHTLWREPSGGFWVLSRRKRPAADLGRDDEIWEDFIEELSPEGRLVRRISLLDAFRRSSYEPILMRLPHQPDIFHTNSIQVFDGSLAALSPHFRRGNILLSIRHLDLLAILDPDAGTIVWTLTGQWRAQHSAWLLPAGRILLFDNFGGPGRTSRALEVDPFTQQITWSFAGRPGEGLYSETSGAVQRLSGGNTLVVESNFGRALEVTPDGRVVWEFVNPNRAGEKGELVATLYHVERVPRDSPLLGAAAGPFVSPAWPRPAPRS
jgi:hypothetical protein